MKGKYLLIFIIIIILTGCTKTYTVTFINDDGTKLSNIDIKKGDNLEDINKPTKEGYIFVSWLKDGIEYDTTKPIKEDITLTANWIETPELSTKYTVTFDFGEEVKTQTVKENEFVIKPVDPIKEKHKFLGWYIEDKLYNFETPVTKNITITAKYEKTRVTINFDLNGGSGTTITEIDKGSRLKKPDNPEKFGYHFVEWTLDGKKYNFDTIVKEDITLKATYEAIEYVKVKFDTDGGTIITPKLLEKGQKLSNVGIPLKEGYTFNYWLLEDKKFDLNTKIEKSITLKAVYEQNILQEDPIEEE